MSNSLKKYSGFLKENNSVAGDYFAPYIFRNKIDQQKYFFTNPIETKLLITGSPQEGKAIFFNTYMVPDTSNITEDLIYFNGSTDHLYLSNETDLDFGTEDFTLDCWVKLDTIQTSSYLPIIETRTNIDQNYLFGLKKVSDKFYIDFKTSTGSLTGTIEIKINTWTHILVTRYLGTISSYIDGVKDSITYSYSGNLNRSSSNIYLFKDIDNNFFKGYSNCLRITKGISLGINKSTLPMSITDYVKNNITYVGI
jgi:hypothetical protein